MSTLGVSLSPFCTLYGTRVSLFFEDSEILISHESLDRVNCFMRIGNCLTLGRVSNLDLSAFHERDNQTAWFVFPSALGIHHRLITLHYRDAGVGRTQVYTYNFAHFSYLKLYLLKIHFYLAHMIVTMIMPCGWNMTRCQFIKATKCARSKGYSGVGCLVFESLVLAV